MILPEFEIFSIYGERTEFLTAAGIEFSKKLHILQTIGVNVGPEHVDADIHRMPQKEYDDECNHSHYAVANHTAHLVNDGGNNAGGKAKRKQTRV